MAKSLKKYKKPPRTAKKPVEEAVTPPVQEQVATAPGVPPNKATVVKKTRKPRPRKPLPESSIPGPPVTEHDDESDAEAHDSGVDMPMRPAIPNKSASNVAPSITSIDEPVEEEAKPLPPETLKFIARWLPRWNNFCHQFPAPDNFAGVAPYCSDGIDLVLLFTRDVTASHIAKKGLPFDNSPHNSKPWDADFNNVFYPCDKVRNFIDINVKRFEMFRDGEEMEGRMWVDMGEKYKRSVVALLEKVRKLKANGNWEAESRRVKEMMKYGVFGKVGVEGDGEDADDELEV